MQAFEQEKACLNIRQMYGTTPDNTSRETSENLDP